MPCKIGKWGALVAVAAATTLELACSSSGDARGKSSDAGGASHAHTGGAQGSTVGASGGSRATGGADASGDTSATAGADASGGTSASGGADASGGTSATAGADASGGTSASGGADASGGTSTSGGASSGGSGGASAGKCVGKANTPGGPDPWGGCFPGDYNTGYPHGLPGDTRAPVTLKTYDGPCSIMTDDTMIDGAKIDKCSSQGLFIYAKRVMIKNSLVNTEIYENANSASVTVMDTEVNGGNQYTFPTIGGANDVTAIRVNSHLGEHTVQCYSNCIVTDSWLHDQYDAGPGPHQNGFLSNGGSNFTIKHNSVDCHSSGCTAGITFIPDDDVSRATVTRNLLVASSPNAGYCMDVASDHPAKSGIVSQMNVTDNVFQRGTKRGEHNDFVCGFYGAVGGWDAPNHNSGTDGYLNVWTNNAFDDGTLINP